MEHSNKVRPKKWLGQHFLTCPHTAQKIVDTLSTGDNTLVLEIGPGMGVLTQRLATREPRLQAVEVDTDSIAYLAQHLPQVPVIAESILTCAILQESQRWIGNLPYNLSSPILFRLLEERTHVTEAVFMLQKEVSQRIAAAAGSKTYGILSVLCQYYYAVTYAFSVPPGAFHPPPKVQSGVIRLARRTQAEELPLAPLATVVKAAFNQRRKMLGNSVKSLSLTLPEGWAQRRAEELSVAEFATLARQLHTPS